MMLKVVDVILGLMSSADGTVPEVVVVLILLPFRERMLRFLEMLVTEGTCLVMDKSICLHPVPKLVVDLLLNVLRMSAVLNGCVDYSVDPVRIDNNTAGNREVTFFSQPIDV